ncbi:MAG: TetR/AcrR family transcriptional regulator [Candidatus Omnitrophica bacterium]|nr:TetR/AcrR family transcriptional regulator [Candidatus Omnitrophota bacterium]
MSQKEYSLREKKHARTKLAIVNTFIKCLEKSRFEDISIREICKSVEVSEGTFFNYFPEKIDIVNYYTRLIFLETVWKAQRDAGQKKSLSLVNAIFERMAGRIDNINIIYQIISVMLMQQEKPKQVNIPDIERHIAFPDYIGIENIPVVFIEDFLRTCLKKAARNGELPKNVKIEDVLVSLMAILGGTLLTTKLTGIKDSAYHYRRQLQLLWKGLGIKD